MRLYHASLPVELTCSPENSGADRLALTPFMMIHGLVAVITACRASYQFPFLPSCPLPLSSQLSGKACLRLMLVPDSRDRCVPLSRPAHAVLCTSLLCCFSEWLTPRQCEQPVPLQSALKCLPRALSYKLPMIFIMVLPNILFILITPPLKPLYFTLSILSSFIGSLMCVCMYV